MKKFVIISLLLVILAGSYYFQKDVESPNSEEYAYLVGFSQCQKGIIFGTINDEEIRKKTSELSDEICRIMDKGNIRNEREFRDAMYKKVDPKYFESFDVSITQGGKTLLNQKGVLPQGD